MTDESEREDVEQPSGEVHVCEEEGCDSTEVAEYHNYYADEPHQVAWLCDVHATEAGYCLWCTHFRAGTEEYDFSPVRGYCRDCLDEIRYEAGEYDDDDYEDDYGD